MLDLMPNIITRFTTYSIGDLVDPTLGACYNNVSAAVSGSDTAVVAADAADKIGLLLISVTSC